MHFEQFVEITEEELKESGLSDHEPLLRSCDTRKKAERQLKRQLSLFAEDIIDTLQANADRNDTLMNGYCIPKLSKSYTSIRKTLGEINRAMASDMGMSHIITATLDHQIQIEEIEGGVYSITLPFIMPEPDDIKTDSASFYRSPLYDAFAAYPGRFEKYNTRAMLIFISHITAQTLDSRNHFPEMVFSHTINALADYFLEDDSPAYYSFHATTCLSHEEKTQIIIGPEKMWKTLIRYMNVPLDAETVIPESHLFQSETERYIACNIPEDEYNYEKNRRIREIELKKIQDAVSELSHENSNTEKNENNNAQESLCMAYRKTNTIRTALKTICSTMTSVPESAYTPLETHTSFNLTDAIVRKTDNEIYHIILPCLMPKKKTAKTQETEFFKEAVKNIIGAYLGEKPVIYNESLAFAFVNCYKESTGNHIHDYDNLIYTPVLDAMCRYFIAKEMPVSVHIDYQSSTKDHTEIYIGTQSQLILYLNRYKKPFFSD